LAEILARTQALPCSSKALNVLLCNKHINHAPSIMSPRCNPQIQIVQA